MDRKTTTVRLSEETLHRLQKASYLLDRSQSNVVEDALNEYFEKHGLTTRYELRVTPTHVVLMKMEGQDVKLVEVGERNGVPPKQIAEQYTTRLQTPVSLVVEGEASP